MNNEQELVPLCDYFTDNADRSDRALDYYLVQILDQWHESSLRRNT